MPLFVTKVQEGRTHAARGVAQEYGSLGGRQYVSELAGGWVGHITGTNTGRVTFQISVSGNSLDGTIDVFDREHGAVRFVFVGSLQDDKFRLRIAPEKWPDGVSIAPGNEWSTV
jgi:hypothetical protein